MKEISKYEDLVKLEDTTYELQQLNSIVGFIQTALAEGASLQNNKELSDALYYIYMKQGALHKQIVELIDE